MKKLYLDQLIFLAVGIILIVVLQTIAAVYIALLFSLLAALCWGYLCRHILLLPLDVILGPKTQVTFFSGRCGIVAHEFFREECNAKWKFYYGNNQTLILIHPESVNTHDINDIQMPRKDEKIVVTYHPLSKVMIRWQQLQQDTPTTARTN